MSKNKINPKTIKIKNLGRLIGSYETKGVTVNVSRQTAHINNFSIFDQYLFMP
jgi:hypothetical protein